MTTLVSERTDEPWRRGLTLPSYQIGEAARYAGISPQTVTAWHGGDKATLTTKDQRAALSYLQLIEVAVVAAFRKAGVTLKEIRAAREYVAKELKAESVCLLFWGAQMKE
jgi:DNA-binding transcriptional MerR regulator